MNKQIEEMARDLCTLNRECDTCPFQLKGIKCNPKRNAERFIAKDYRKSTDVAFEATDNFRDAIMDVFIDMCCGNDYNKLTLLQIGDAIDAVYDKQIADIKKKYESEGADDD